MTGGPEDGVALAGESVYDVAIVGYGPAGVVAAALLGQAGIRVHVCDRLREVYEIPRAIALDHEIMRVFQNLGVIDAVLPYTEPFTNSEWLGADGRLIRRMTMIAPPWPQGHTPSIVFTQPAVERVLRERVSRMPEVTVALGTEVGGITQDAHGVSLTTRSAEGESGSVRARWAIACDGGASQLRSAVGIELEDLDFDEPWLVVDVRVNERGLAKLPATSVQYCEPDRPCTIVIGPANHRRWEISLKAGEDPVQAASPEGTWALLARWITPEDATLWRQSSYRFHALVAQTWRAGRVFVAGDAAHMQPPFLGQGMCQGVRDVANLSWKLAAVIKGGGVADRAMPSDKAQALLDSYGTERKAHVRELTGRLKALGAIICERDPDKARSRDAKLLDACGGVVVDTPRQDVLPRLEGGLLAATDTSGRGTLFPQPRLEGGELMDERTGCGWRLVLDATMCAADIAASQFDSGLTIVSLAPDGTPEAEGVVAAWMARHACRAALVRPDHYVYGTAADDAGVQALLAEWRAAFGL